MDSIEREKAIEVYNESVDLSAHLLGEVTQKASGGGAAVMSSCMLFVSTAIACELSLHDAMSMLMESYRHAEKQIRNSQQ